MKIKLAIAFGTGLGALVYDLINKGFHHIDWTKSAFITVFVFLVFLVVPNRFFENKKRN